MAAGMRRPSTARLLRALSPLAVLAALGACSLTEPDDDPYRITGTVRSAYSDTPIAGARLSLATLPALGVPSVVLGTATTDAAGRYELTGRHPTGKVPFSSCGDLGFEVEADRYEPWNILQEPDVACTSDLQTLDFRLVPFPASITVLPDSATVRVGESLSLSLAVTYVDGSAGPDERRREFWYSSRLGDLRALSTGPCGVLEEVSFTGFAATYRAPATVPDESCGGTSAGQVKLSLDAGVTDTVHITIVP